MRCPYCRSADSRVVDSRETNDGDAIRRRRACLDCILDFSVQTDAHKLDRRAALELLYKALPGLRVAPA